MADTYKLVRSLHTIQKFFRLSCLIATVVMIIYCLTKYILNESTSQVDFQILGNRDIDIYPSLSVCIYRYGLYKEDKMKERNITNASREYKNFLYGKIWSAKLLKIDYDEYTIGLENYITSIKVDNRGSRKTTIYDWSPNDTKIEGEHIGDVNFPFYISYRSDKEKCYSLDLSDGILALVKGTILRQVVIEFENFALSKVGLHIYLHYPKQLFRSLPVYTIQKLDNGESNLTGSDEITVTNMKVIRRRMTNKTPCNKEWKTDDEKILTRIMNKVGCEPPHWKLHSHFPTCDTMEKMKSSSIPPAYNLDTNLLKNLDSPCHQIYVITHDSARKETTYWKQRRKNVTRMIKFDFRMRYYEEISHIRLYDAESLVGNVGGYIGLFLGFALWQVPSYLEHLLQ